MITFKEFLAENVENGRWTKPMTPAQRKDEKAMKKAQDKIYDDDPDGTDETVPERADKVEDDFHKKYKMHAHMEKKEAKFKVGDWVTWKDGSHQRAGVVTHIEHSDPADGDKWDRSNDVWYDIETEYAPPAESRWHDRRVNTDQREQDVLKPFKFRPLDPSLYGSATERGRNELLRLVDKYDMAYLFGYKKPKKSSGDDLDDMVSDMRETFVGFVFSTFYTSDDGGYITFAVDKKTKQMRAIIEYRRHNHDTDDHDEDDATDVDDKYVINMLFADRHAGRNQEMLDDLWKSGVLAKAGLR